MATTGRSLEQHVRGVSVQWLEAKPVVSGKIQKVNTSHGCLINLVILLVLRYGEGSNTLLSWCQYISLSKANHDGLPATTNYQKHAL